MARTTINFTDDQNYKDGLKRAKALKYRSFSAYCEHLIKKDLEERPAHVTVREEAGQYSADKKKSRRSSAA